MAQPAYVSRELAGNGLCFGECVGLIPLHGEPDSDLGIFGVGRPVDQPGGDQLYLEGIVDDIGALSPMCSNQPSKLASSSTCCASATAHQDGQTTTGRCTVRTVYVRGLMSPTSIPGRRWWSVEPIAGEG